MKILRESEIARQEGFFHVLAGSGKSQAASMVLRPGQASGEYGSEHPQSDQWLAVLAGRGTAKVSEKDFEVGAGDVLLIEAGEAHQITNTGDVDLHTLNFYSPPAY